MFYCCMAAGSPSKMLETTFYMPCIDLRDRRCLVVGAGKVGLEKISGLLDCEALVRVVAPEVSEPVAELAEKGRIELFERPYEDGDLDGCFLVIAATSNTDLNRKVFEDAEARAMLVNVVDVPALCNFILPAITRRAPLAIAISTAGASPALAKRIKREVGQAIGSSYAELALILFELRAWAKNELATYEARRDFFEGIVNGSPDPIALLDAGERAAVDELIEKAKAAAVGGEPGGS